MHYINSLIIRKVNYTIFRAVVDDEYQYFTVYKKVSNENLSRVLSANGIDYKHGSAEVLKQGTLEARIDTTQFNGKEEL